MAKFILNIFTQRENNKVLILYSYIYYIYIYIYIIYIYIYLYYIYIYYILYNNRCFIYYDFENKQ
jgi:hypothetical protein